MNEEVQMRIRLTLLPLLVCERKGHILILVGFPEVVQIRRLPGREARGLRCKRLPLPRRITLCCISRGQSSSLFIWVAHPTASRQPWQVAI